MFVDVVVGGFYRLKHETPGLDIETNVGYLRPTTLSHRLKIPTYFKHIIVYSIQTKGG